MHNFHVHQKEAWVYEQLKKTIERSKTIYTKLKANKMEKIFAKYITHINPVNISNNGLHPTEMIRNSVTREMYKHNDMAAMHAKHPRTLLYCPSFSLSRFQWYHTLQVRTLPAQGHTPVRGRADAGSQEDDPKYPPDSCCSIPKPLL